MSKKPISPELLNILACPKCKGEAKPYPMTKK
jgi:uncharacterized protein YbaR (Trm112 family)